MIEKCPIFTLAHTNSFQNKTPHVKSDSPAVTDLKIKSQTWHFLLLTFSLFTIKSKIDNM